jgi:hypothetical protein
MIRLSFDGGFVPLSKASWIARNGNVRSRLSARNYRALLNACVSGCVW